MSDFLLELEAELSVALAAQDKKSKRAADLDTLKKKKGNMRLPTAVRQEASEAYRSIMQEVEAERWASIATVAMFTEQTCDGCGSVHHIFLQYMETQCLVSKPETLRWSRVQRPNLGLPKETLIQPHQTHICSSCCEDHDFWLGDAKAMPKTEQPITPSGAYIQEDINGQPS